MIEALKHYDAKQAAGLLARAALSMDYADAPSPSPEGEKDVMARVFQEVRAHLGLASEDDSPEALEKITAFLDDESDRLLPPVDTQAALHRLALRGDLPSDLYEVKTINNIAEIYGKHFPLERDVIETTIKRPDVEQHFGPSRKPGEPAMISVFQRLFRTKWPLRDFICVVAGQRDGFIMNVHQSWRIYPARVDIAGAKTPIDLLQRFAAQYGVDLDVDGKKGHFIVSTTTRRESKVQIISSLPNQRFTVSHFSQLDKETGATTSSLVIGVNNTKYLAALKELRVKREDMLDDLVNEPVKAMA
ncbi:hypothetical protein JQK88_30595 [Mesorhizobium caraganae]|uniref:hypothetical protein n=1 Tax=Mesorhizobium caraganae TaxID=483206 RepID=UPI001939D09A|nr:hypothetical protein [Mesorhizobium caraganae]MBM2715479.1 hypothetical protein [Mesorhizobium caraganae]